MKTVIKAGGRLFTAETRNPIPQNSDLTVNYDAYLKRIEAVYDDRIKNRLKNDLTKEF